MKHSLLVAILLAGRLCRCEQGVATAPTTDEQAWSFGTGRAWAGSSLKMGRGLVLSAHYNDEEGEEGVVETAQATGYFSTAMGLNTHAHGAFTTAMGEMTIAYGEHSTAMGSGTNASGPASTAMGHETTASGEYSFATGSETIASGDTCSTAMGRSTRASGDISTAMGDSTTASGDFSTAMGAGTTASGDISTAMGDSTTASGGFSTAMGRWTTASSFAEVTIGQYNEVSVSPDGGFTWQEADSVFRVGIGSSTNAPKDAFRILKSGDVLVRDDITGDMLNVAQDCCSGAPGRRLSPAVLEEQLALMKIDNEALKADNEALKARMAVIEAAMAKLK